MVIENCVGRFSHRQVGRMTGNEMMLMSDRRRDETLIRDLMDDEEVAPSFLRASDLSDRVSDEYSWVAEE